MTERLERIRRNFAPPNETEPERRVRIHAAVKRAEERIREEFPTPPELERGRPPTGPRITEGLTDRQVEVLALIADGKDNRETAVALAVSGEAVKSHVKNMLARLGAKNRTHAVAIALRKGYIE